MALLRAAVRYVDTCAMPLEYMMGEPTFKMPTHVPLGGLFGLGRQAPGPATLALLGHLSSPPPGLLGRSIAAEDQHVNRRAFFSFHYDDVMRVNNVRKAYEFAEGGKAQPNRFFDSSLWESKKLSNPEAIKSLIRSGVGHTSVVCILLGTDTWAREWVRYEIARAVVDNRGLLAVHLNGISHHSRRAADPQGLNPLHYMGVYKRTHAFMQPPTWHLCEWTARGWVPYQNHVDAIERPRYLPDAAPNVVVRLSEGTAEYCYATQLGSFFIGRWIDHAAKAVGR